MSDSWLFAVSTHSFLCLVRVSRDWLIEGFRTLATGHHYGIALPSGDGSRFVAQSGHLTSYVSQGTEIGAYRPGVAVSLIGSFGEVHQIAYAGHGIYVANTHSNSVAWVLPDGTEVSRYHFGAHTTDVNHINSVFPLSADRVLCLLHNRGKLSEVALVERSSAEKLELLHRAPLWHTSCHNVYLGAEHLAYNASAAGQFVVVDTQLQKVLRRVKLPGHTKGLSVLDDYYVVGFSDHAEREHRSKTNGQLAVISRETLDLRAVIDLNHPSLPHPIGNVNEIRCLSHQDHGHHSTEVTGAGAESLDLARYDVTRRLWVGLRFAQSRLQPRQLGRRHAGHGPDDGS